MPKIFTRRELPIALGLPLALQMAQQQLKAADKAADLKMTADQRKSLKILLPGDLTFPPKESGNTQITLWGNPDQEMSNYGLHFRWERHSNGMPHMHKYDRYCFVLKGTWWVAAGPAYDMASAIPVPAGTLVIHQARELHYDGAKDEPVEMLIMGNGPRANITADGQPQAGERG